MSRIKYTPGGKQERRKILFRRLVMGVIAIAVVISSSITAPVIATYVSDHKNNPRDLYEIKLLYDAVMQCFNSTEKKSITAPLSSASWVGGDIERTNVQNYYGLHNDSLFEGVDDAGNVYSHLLEQISTSQRDDGIIWCNERDLMIQLLNKVGAMDLPKIICNGKNSGLFDIEVYAAPGSFGDTIDLDVSDWKNANIKDGKSNCNDAFDFLRAYTEQYKNENPPNPYAADRYMVYVSMSLSDGAATHLANFLAPYIGDVSNVGEMANYYRYRDTFDSVCTSISSSQTTPPLDSSQFYSIYDADDGAVHYIQKSDVPNNPNTKSDTTIYVGVTKGEGMTCAELAELLSVDGGGLDSFIEDCRKQYKDKLNELKKDLNTIKLWKPVAENYVEQARDVVAWMEGGSAPTTTDDDGGTITLTPSVLKYNIDRSLKGMKNSTLSGGASPYGSAMSTLLEAISDLADNTEVTRGEITSKPSSEVISSVKTTVSNVTNAVEKRASDARKLQNLIDSAEGKADGDDIWEIGDDGFVCSGVDKLVEDFNKLNISDITVTGYTKPSGETNDSTINPGGSSTNSGEEDICFAGGQAASMGWIICPVLNFLRNALSAIYDNFIEPQLQIDSDLVSTDNAAYQAWGFFRNTANIIFVILLLVVIFSQVTGFGIDTYGIRRILPRLIIAAVLINLSFIICQFLVDISNIVGSGVNSLLTNFANSTYGGQTSHMEYLLDNIWGGLALGGAAVVGVGAAVMLTNGAVILPMLLGLLSALIAVLFMFVIISVRKALVVVLVVLSPLAFVMYMFPNTNSVFKRWVNLMKSMLLVYPICGLLVGGGYMACKIIVASSTDFVTNLVGMLVSVAPFFFVPTILKSSVAALGSIGNKIGGLGRAMGHGASGAIRSTDGYKRAQTNMAASNGPFGLRKKAYERGLGTKSWRNRYARDLAAKENMNRTDAQNATYLANALNPDASFGQISENFTQAMEKGDEQGMAVALNRMASLNQKDASKFIAGQIGGLDVVGSEGDRKKLSAMRTAVSRNENFQRYFDGKETDASRMLTGNGMASNGTYQNLSTFSRQFAQAMETKDVTSLSADALKRAVQSGEFRGGLADELLRSEDPAVKSMLSDPAKRQVIEAAATAAGAARTAAGANWDGKVPGGNYTDNDYAKMSRVYQEAQETAREEAEHQLNVRQEERMRQQARMIGEEVNKANGNQS